MFDVRMTSTFRDWLRSLRDRRAQERVAQRIARLESGLLGDARFFQGIGELKVDHGPGYRLYFVRRRGVIFILLCGGDKSTQQWDIEKAGRMAKDLPHDH